MLDFLEKNPELKKELHLIKETILSPDKTVIYFGKNNLKQKIKKKEAAFSLYFYISSLAACLLLLIGINYLFRNQNNPRNAFIAEKPIKKNTTISLENNAEISLTESLQATPTHSMKSFLGEGVQLHKINETAKPLDSVFISAATVISEKPKLSASTETNYPPALKDVTMSTSTTESSVDEREGQLINASFLSDEIQIKTVFEQDSKAPEGQFSKPDYQNVFDDKEPKSRSYLTLSEILIPEGKKQLGKLLKDQNFASTNLEQRENIRNLNFWDVASLLSKGISNVTGKKVELKNEFDNSGNIVALEFIAGDFRFSKK